MYQVRVGRRTQKYPVFVRMLDKDSNWGYNNGLKTLVTTLLQMSMVGKLFWSFSQFFDEKNNFEFSGYPFVLPDMIGGNGYSDDPLDQSQVPTKELFVRWLQVVISISRFFDMPNIILIFRLMHLCPQCNSRSYLGNMKTAKNLWNTQRIWLL